MPTQAKKGVMNGEIAYEVYHALERGISDDKHSPLNALMHETDFGGVDKIDYSNKKRFTARLFYHGIPVHVTIQPRYTD